MATRNFSYKQRQAFWRVNQNIRAGQLRVIGPDGKQIGVISKDEALKKAQELGLDLVEIAPGARPPVAKIIDFTKFRYQQDKKNREQKLKERKGSEQKEIWLTPFMGNSDYQVRLSRIKEFLEEGHKVRVIVKFTGRQMAHTEFGYEATNRVATDLKDIARMEGRPKFMGRQLIAMVTPVKGQVTGQGNQVIGESGNLEQKNENKTQTE